MVLFEFFGRKTVLRVLLQLLVLSVSIKATLAMDMQVVKSPGGIKAVLVEDYTLPLVAISISFDGGAAADPPGKNGSVRLLTTLLDEGAGGLDSQEFQGRMEALGMQMGFSSSRDSITGRMKVLRSNLEPAVEIFPSCAGETGFQPRCHRAHAGCNQNTHYTK